MKEGYVKNIQLKLIVALAFAALLGSQCVPAVVAHVALEQKPVLQKTVKVCASYDFVNRTCKRWRIVKR